MAESAALNEPWSNPYELGHATEELDRLSVQGRALGPPTQTLLQAAGLREGMRVLDLGAGAGDMSFAIADVVGDSGETIGIERSADAVLEARAAAGRQGRANTSFIEGDIHKPLEGQLFDAVSCRLVLMYVPDPATVLKTQAASVRRGGIVAPIEFDVETACTIPATPLATQALNWAKTASERTGINISLGPQLWHVLQAAGLNPAGMLSIQTHFAPNNPDGHALLAGIVRTLLPAIESAGIATPSDVGIDTLQRRLREEMEAASAVFAFPALTCVWAVI